MGKVINYISVFMIWLAGFIFSVHMIIPHDHHSPGAFCDLDEKCTLSHESPAHHSRFPAHCHAFNDVIAEKYSLVLLLPVFQNNITPLTVQNEELSQEVQISSVLYIYHQTLPDSFKSGPSRLRAPPSLV